MGAYVRRSMIPEEDRFSVDNFFGKKISKTSDIRFAQSDYRTLFDNIKESFKATDTRLDRILTVILVIAIVLAISMTVYVIVTPKEGEKFTEFYILGPGGNASGYPTNLNVGEEGEVIIGVMNHEYANVTYQLEVKLNGEVIDEKSIDLMHNETWESLFTFKVERAGEDQKLEFLLFKNHFEERVYGKEDKEEPYRSLHLWVNVK
jgi:uncharacterized membrane protein